MAAPWWRAACTSKPHQWKIGKTNRKKTHTHTPNACLDGDANDERVGAPFFWRLLIQILAAPPNYIRPFLAVHWVRVDFLLFSVLVVNCTAHNIIFIVKFPFFFFFFSPLIPLLLSLLNARRPRFNGFYVARHSSWRQANSPSKNIDRSISSLVIYPPHLQAMDKTPLSGKKRCNCVTFANALAFVHFLFSFSLSRGVQ